MKRLKILPLSRPVKAAVVIPGSKSYTNRALLLAALTFEPVTLVNPLLSDDTESMISCLKTLGIKVVSRPGSLEVVNSVAAVRDGDYELDAGLSGTTMRFMLALSAVIPGRQTLRGQQGLEERPIGDIVSALQELGADIEYLGKKGYPPARVLSSKLTPGIVTINGSESSQYLSALLMIAPLVGDITIKVAGKLISTPYVAMTIDAVEQFGARVTAQDHHYHIVSGQSYGAAEYAVEGDVSSAGYFAAIAALTKSTVTLKNINPHSKQADMSFLKILEQMGNVVTYGKDTVTVTGKGVRPMKVDMRDCPDQAQTLAVLAAFADGVTTITGIRSLRIKETERIKALQQELQKMGIKTASTPDSLTIHGGNPKAAPIATHGDHRMAMAFAVAGARLAGMVIEDPGVVSKTFPGFWQQLAVVGVKSRPLEQNIVLIGMRGCGKTTVADHLARRLGREHLDLDASMVENLGMNTAEIVNRHGWAYFRDQESAIAVQLSKLDNKVLSTGGGIVLRPQNITVLRASGVVILLQASAAVLINRLRGSHDRPPLTAAKNLRAEVRQVLKERRAAYEAVADIIIDTDALRSEQVADQILARLRELKGETL